MFTIKFKKMVPEAKIPEYKTKGAACADLYSVEDTILKPGVPVLVRTGLQIAYICSRYAIEIRPRSSLALKGLLILNSPGTIDSDYRGELMVIMLSLGNSYTIAVGDRIAQMYVHRVEKGCLKEGEIVESERGEGGFGSTGR